MPELPVKPPPPPMPQEEILETVDQRGRPAPIIQADPIDRYRAKGARGSWDEDGNYQGADRPQKRDWTFSEFCHAATLAVVFGILVLLCVTTARNESRYQKAVREAEAVRERLEATQREYEAGVGRIMGGPLPR